MSSNETTGGPRPEESDGQENEKGAKPEVTKSDNKVNAVLNVAPTFRDVCDQSKWGTSRTTDRSIKEKKVERAICRNMNLTCKRRRTNYAPSVKQIKRRIRLPSSKHEKIIINLKIVYTRTRWGRVGAMLPIDRTHPFLNTVITKASLSTEKRFEIKEMNEP